MARAMHRLMAIEIDRLAGRKGMHCDGGGLYLCSAPPTQCSWLFRYRFNGKARWMGLGAFPDISLSDARALASEARRLKAMRIDPLEDRNAKRDAEKLEIARRVSFEEAATRYIAAHEAAWRNPVHRKQWRSTLTAYVYPIFGHLPVSAVDTALVSKALEPIWNSKPETAGRVRGRVERILDWAKVRGYRDGENPARWKGHLDHLLPDRRKVKDVEHHAAMSYATVPDFIARLRDRPSLSAKALEVTILCATRTSETIGAKPSEFNLSEKVWIIPAERMKAGKEHRIPLSPRAIEILEPLLRNAGDFVFGGDKPFSNMAMLELLRGMEGVGLTVHGFRSSFRDWVSERTKYPREVAEMALAHTVADRVEAAYRRGDLFEKRRRLMNEWGKFCASKIDATLLKEAS